MARTRTLAQLQGDLQYLADIQGLTARHDATTQTRMLNQSIQRFRAKLSAEGVAHYLVSTASATWPNGPTSPYHFGVLDLSAVTPNVVQVYAIDVKVGADWYGLDCVDFTARNEYHDTNATRRPPVAFANFQTAKCAVFPASDQSYTYNAWYLPVLTDLSASSDTFDGVAGWEEWVVWDAMIPIINRDQYPQVYAMATAERAERWSDIIRVASRVNRMGAVQRRDTWGDTQYKRRFSRERLP